MQFDLQTAMALLERTPAALDAWLRGLPESWTSPDEGENTMNVIGVLGHLINGERTDWMARARLILEAGVSRPFVPFDRWAHLRESEGKPLGQLLDEFASARSQNLNELRAMQLTEVDLQRCGLHPVLGKVTLGQLLATWTAHDLTHLHQISRILAHQYREAVGPWSAFLGVMHCAGHSA